MTGFDIFPKRGVTIYGLKSKFQNLGDLEINLDWLIDIIPLKRMPSHERGEIVWMDYEAIEPYREMCYGAIKELVDDVTQPEEIDRYRHLYNKINIVIELFSSSTEIINANMTAFFVNDDNYFRYCENWYKLIYNELLIVQRHFNNKFDALKQQIPSPVKSKVDDLRDHISPYGFFDLQKLASLSEEGKGNLIQMICDNDLPYAIAMFDYLGFIDHLKKHYIDTSTKLNEVISKWFNSDRAGRAVKGNINVLSENSNEHKGRYTAWKHKEIVITDYKQLK